MSRSPLLWSRARCASAFAFLLSVVPTLVWPVDLITFSNGDKWYGRVIGYRRLGRVEPRMVDLKTGGILRDLLRVTGRPQGQLIVELDGKQLAYHPGAIERFDKDVVPSPAVKTLQERVKPPPGVAQLVQRADGVDVEASIRPLGDGRQLTVVAEKGISVPIITLGAFSSPFFSCRGCYVQGTIRNAPESLVEAGYNHRQIHGFDFTVHAYDANDKFLASQRFYLFRFPPGRAAPFSVHFSNLSVDQVAMIRIVRKF